jgi:hypothetical protein
MKKSIVHLHKVPNTVPNICSKKNTQEKEEAWLSLLTKRFLDIDFLAGDHLERSTSARRSQGRQSLRHSPDERRRSNAHSRHGVVSFFFASFYTVSSFFLRPATLWKTRLSHTGYLTARCTASLSELQVLINFGPSSGHLEFHCSTTDLQWKKNWWRIFAIFRKVFWKIIFHDIFPVFWGENIRKNDAFF